MVKVSFVIIGYNVEAFIEKTINSILVQTLKEIELIFVDDGSTDNTLKIVTKLQEKDNRLKVITQKNSGANAARKNGFLNASGEYISFVDGDDYIRACLAEECYNYCIKNDLDILCFNHYLKYPNVEIECLRSGICNSSEDYLKLILSESLPHELWNKMFRNDFLKNANFQNVKEITMGDDLVANVLLGMHKPKFDTIESVYYYYVQREESIMNKSSEKTLEIVDALNEVENMLLSINRYNEYIKEVEFLWFYHCFFSKIVNVNLKRGRIEEVLYKKWKSRKVMIKNNEIIKQYIKSFNIKLRIKLYIFELNYGFGKFCFNVKEVVYEKRFS